jgi:hypothetical protein
MADRTIESWATLIDFIKIICYNIKKLFFTDRETGNAADRNLIFKKNYDII